MLSRVNRIARAADFRTTVRTGRRVGTPHSVVYLVSRRDDGPTRFGFIVAKSVGNSVVRHRMTRRLRAIGHEILPSRPVGTDVIVRALPGSDDVAWATLHLEIAQAVDRGVAQR